MEIVKGEPLLQGEELQNAIIEYFENYIQANGYSIKGVERSRIPTNFFRATFNKINKDVFKPNNINTLDIETLETIAETYIYLCQQYAIATMTCFFADYIGVDNDTINRWCNGDTKTAIYRDDITGKIFTHVNSMQYFKACNPNCKIQTFLSVGYCEVAKKIKALRQDIVISKSLDFQNGILMDLNNGRETGTEYNQKRALETAQVSNILALNDLPTLGNVNNKQIESVET